MVKVVVVGLFAHCGKEGHLQNRCYDLIGWPDKTTNISSSDTPSNVRTGSSPTITPNHLHHQVFQLHAFPKYMGSQGPWIIDSGASDHISANESVFSSISSPKFPHFISLANGSKMVSQGVGQ
ncbi:hypothetical protein CR513_21211, partial [Mucuna pruriens]